jgi:hypothetical protein
MREWAYEFQGVKAGAELVIQGRAFYDRAISALGDGERVLMKLSKWKDTRTSKQNRLIWGGVYRDILEQLADDVGYDKHDARGKDQLHEALCIKYGGTVKDPLTGYDVRKFRSSQANKQEFSDYVEWIARWAATEHGIVVTLPGEL